MDDTMAANFLTTISKFLQSLCNGYVHFTQECELNGHFFLTIDKNKNESIDSILKESVKKSDSNIISSTSKSYHADISFQKKSDEKREEKSKGVGNDEVHHQKLSNEDVSDMPILEVQVSTSTNKDSLESFSKIEQKNSIEKCQPIVFKQSSPLNNIKNSKDQISTDEYFLDERSGALSGNVIDLTNDSYSSQIELRKRVFQIPDKTISQIEPSVVKTKSAQKSEVKKSSENIPNHGVTYIVSVREPVLQTKRSEELEESIHLSQVNQSLQTATNRHSESQNSHPKKIHPQPIQSGISELREERKLLPEQLSLQTAT